MSRVRFNIASLLVLVLVLAVGFAALREANDLWDSAVFTLTVGLLLGSVLLAVHRTERRRAFWLGFAIFGSTYLGFSLVPPIETRLLTTRGLSYLDSKMPGRSSDVVVFRYPTTGTVAPGDPVQAVAFTPQGTRIASSYKGKVRLWDTASGRLLGSGDPGTFVRIGHSLFALIFAWLGGLISRRLSRGARTTDALPGQWSTQRTGRVEGPASDLDRPGPERQP
jgi:hypothetical protein